MVRDILLILPLLVAASPAISFADESPTGANLPEGIDLDSLLFQTDHFVQHGWRIQQNSETGEFRLLNGRDKFVCRGDFQTCLNRFNELREEKKVPPVTGKVVILVHGMFRDHRASRPIEPALNEAGYKTIRVGYASTRTGIEEHAAAVARVISHLPEAEEINFVAHSMGSIVVRKYLSDALEADGKLDPRIKRFVMLGPPNQGSALAVSAARFNRNDSPGVTQLGTGAKEFLGKLKHPPIEFGIIAGTSAEGSQGSPLLEGADDLVIRVDETPLPGASDYQILPIVHMRMFANPTVQKCVVSFLDHGYFFSEEKRIRLPKEEAIGE